MSMLAAMQFNVKNEKKKLDEFKQKKKELESHKFAIEYVDAMINYQRGVIYILQELKREQAQRPKHP